MKMKIGKKKEKKNKDKDSHFGEKIEIVWKVEKLVWDMQKIGPDKGSAKYFFFFWFKN